MRLTQNMRVLPSAAAFAAWLENLGSGRNCWAEPTEECPDLDRIELPPGVHVFETSEELNDLYITMMRTMLPPHRLQLRVGAVVILMRNVNIQQGLCNGTRMIITRLGNDVIECKVMTESSAMRGQTYTLNRFKFEYHDTRTNGSGLHFWRIQFPVNVGIHDDDQSLSRRDNGQNRHFSADRSFRARTALRSVSRVRTAFSIGIWAPNHHVLMVVLG
uniref:ATP-dependent DNA helicase n=1 Tax=Ditylenchus dipsaci TaxID=166011 RepID=A0A915CSR2_9BILA